MSEAATNKVFNFELVSPERKLVSEPVAMATIPGEDGELGVGAGHQSLVASLKAGVVKLTGTQSGKERRIFVAGGFADITPEGCVVLAEEASNIETLDEGRLEQQIRDLKEDLTLVKDEADRKRVREKLALAKAKLEAVTGKILPYEAV